MTADEPRTLLDLLDAWEAAREELGVLRNRTRRECARDDAGPEVDFRRVLTIVEARNDAEYWIRQEMLVLNFMKVLHAGRLYYWTCFNNLRAVDVAEVPEASEIESVR